MGYPFWGTPLSKFKEATHLSIPVLVLVFAAALVVGYKVLSHIPSLLHTPLMSSMNALDGVIVLGALTACHFATTPVFGFLGGVAVALATTNVFGGFDITNKMLKMIAGSGKKRG